ncbi:protein kinase family protein [bacterium]|nr:protein kinase family protein [bacterium]
MSPPAWTRNKTKYKKYPQPNGSVTVVHMSPTGKKVVRVPRNSVSNVPSFLKKYFNKKLSGVFISRNSNGRVKVTQRTKGSERTNFLPIKNPSQANIELFIKNRFMTPMNTKLFMRPANYVRKTRVSNFFQNSTNNGRTGTALTSLNKAGGLRTVYNVSKGKKSVRLGIAKLGGGEQAVVYLGYTDPECTRPLSIKVFPFDGAFAPNNQPSEMEFRIGKILHDIVPRHVPAYKSIEKIVNFVPEKNLNRLTGPMFKSHQTVIFSEYFHGGDFRSWYEKVHSRVKENDLIDIIRQVLDTLVKIQDKYPEFRHNDLHIGNVFIDDTGAKPRAAIADFGLAKLTSKIVSPIVSSGVFLKNGIGMKTDKRYDAHMFLNRLRKISGSFPRLKLFLNLAIPVGYRGDNDTYVTDGRLKYGMDYPGLPSTRAMLRMITPMVRTENLSQAILKLKKTVTAPVVPKGTDAASVAARMLGNVPGVKVTTTAVAKKKPAAKLLQFKKTGGPNATARARTNAGAFAQMIKNVNALRKKENKAARTIQGYWRKKRVVAHRASPVARNALNNYTKNKNIEALTVRNLRKVLEAKGIKAANAKREARAWAKAWINRVGARRVNLQLTRGSNGRIRKNKRLLESFKKDELIAMARRHGLTHAGKTKAQLVNTLWKH